jgi:hypothetical protein
MITKIDNDPAKVSGYSDREFLALATKLADNHAATHGQFTAAVIMRLIGMVGRNEQSAIL